MAVFSDPNWRLTYTLEFVRKLGFSIGLDFDGDLLITTPEAVSVPAMVELLRSCKQSLAAELEASAYLKSKQLVGGPLNGQRHGSEKHVLVERIGPRRWAAYYRANLYGFNRDGRAFFVGEATSEKKARQLGWAKGPKLLIAGQAEDDD